MRGERLNDGLTTVAIGYGPPLVMLPGLGMGADFTAKVPASTAFTARLLAAGFKRRVHVIQRPTNMPTETTVAELAGWHAKALRERFDGPVDVMGTSAGGVTALQLAVDHPELVRRLILCTAASRPGDQGKRELHRLMQAERQGRHDPWAASGLVRQGPLRLLTFAGYLLPQGKRAQGEYAMVEAVQTWDVTDRLGEVTAPTLVIGGTRDEIIPPDLVRATAAGIPEAQLLLVEGGDHISTMRDRRIGPTIREFLQD